MRDPNGNMNVMRLQTCKPRHRPNILANNGELQSRLGKPHQHIEIKQSARHVNQIRAIAQNIDAHDSLYHILFECESAEQERNVARAEATDDHGSTAPECCRSTWTSKQTERLCYSTFKEIVLIYISHKIGGVSYYMWQSLTLNELLATLVYCQRMLYLSSKNSKDFLKINAQNI
ncbi:uncharacterized protein LOC119632231 isoform X2 [Glossina fuscipes]|uniref:Uncharacterized protein LOC119632231 isoform X2 n=1 Tax=Glossina fuscipes TaxID=7396 RepID=A0A8U0W7C0_9MUSC|nr:uncharacterized protein LOC119632231 isoform X2 [Glossina fuscipes]